MSNCRVSVIIPNRNGAATIGLCLEAALASRHDSFEVVVVDDGSEDNSLEIISRHPCTLVSFNRPRGSSAARNAGAAHSRGRILFFIDADCLLERETIRLAEEAAMLHGPATIVGGTYTNTPYDRGFYSFYQSVFVNFSETRHGGSPDYLAAHAMILHAEAFRRSGGFPERFLPIIEDVEFSHRLRRQGYRLRMEPHIQVRHIFNFTLTGSLANAFRKSFYWTTYSLNHRDLLADSGCASHGLKISALLLAAAAGCLLTSYLLPETVPRTAALLPLLLNPLINGSFLRHCRAAGGIRFAIPAALYTLLPYPAAAGLGGLWGLVRHLLPAAGGPSFGTSLRYPKPAGR